MKMSSAMAMGSVVAKALRVVVLVAALVVAAVMQGAQSCDWVEGNFSHTCRNIELIDGGITLRAECQVGGDGPFQFHQIYLNDHVNNDGGHLSCTTCHGAFHVPERCEFSHSCDNIQLTANHILSADCGDGDGNTVSSFLDLDACIKNQMGHPTWVCGGFKIF